MASMIPSYYGGRRTSNILDPFSLDVWDPSEGFGFPSMLTTSGTGDRTGITNTRVDWRETPEAHIFTADLPGLKKDEVKVDLEDERVLVISGERAREREEDTDKWHRVERQRGKFTRRFRLPENAALDAIKANMEHGVLTVTVPKHPGRTPQTKSVNIAG